MTAHDDPAPYRGLDGTGRAIRRRSAVRAIVVGLLWATAGVVITAVTYAHAAGGGVYVVAFGPMIYGAVRVAVGAWTYARTAP